MNGNECLESSDCRTKAAGDFVETTDRSKTWANLFVDNRIMEKGGELKCISPLVSNGQRVVRFHSDEVMQKEQKWQNTLLGCLYGMKPRWERFNTFVQARLMKYGVCEQVLKNGPFTFDNHPIVLKKWQPRMNMEMAVCTLPIWRQLPSLPWEF